MPPDYYVHTMFQRHIFHVLHAPVMMITPHSYFTYNPPCSGSVDPHLPPKDPYYHSFTLNYANGHPRTYNLHPLMNDEHWQMTHFMTLS